MIATRYTIAGANAKANDGTQGVYYVAQHPAPGSPVTLVIDIAGGGDCYFWFPQAGANVTLNKLGNCYERPLGLRSTSSHGPTLDLETIGGIMSDSPDNPVAAAHKVRVPYVTSDLWTGNSNMVVETDGTAAVWHWRGRAILDALLTTLTASALYAAAERLIVIGHSAGGYGLLAGWQDVYDGLAAPGKTVYGIIDGGYVLDYPPFLGPSDWARRRFANAAAVWGSGLGGNAYLGPHIVAGLTPEAAGALMIAQSQFDTAIINRAGVIDTSVIPRNLPARTWAVGYAEALRSDLALSSVGAVYCPWHAERVGTTYELAHVMFRDQYHKEFIDGVTPAQALARWLEGETVWEIEPSPL